MWTTFHRRLALLAVAAMLAAGAVQAQGTATVLLPEDLSTMNPYTTTALITMQVVPAIVEPLVGVDPDGAYYPILAAEVPTVANGGVADDGRTITWRLEPGIVWSDGEPFTADDVVFTYEAATTGTDTVRAGAFAGVASVEAVDDATVVVRYEEYNSSYLDQFQWGILPRHATGDPADMGSWAFNRAPVGTGPFVLREWRTGDRILSPGWPGARSRSAPARRCSTT